MDALDGGHWQYGDDSMPDGGRDLLRRHVRAATRWPWPRRKAVLEHLKEQARRCRRR